MPVLELQSRSGWRSSLVPEGLVLGHLFVDPALVNITALDCFLPSQNVSEYMLVLALCLVSILETKKHTNIKI